MQAPSTISLLLFLGLAQLAWTASPTKTEPSKKPCRPARVEKSAPTYRDYIEPGFGRKALDLSFVAKAKSIPTPPPRKIT